MSKFKINPLITASLMSAVCLAGVSNFQVAHADEQLGANSLTAEYLLSAMPELNERGQRRYIVNLKQAPLAQYNGTGSFAPIPRGEGNRLMSQSPAAQAYVSHLVQQQNQFISQLSASFQRTVNAVFTYQYGLNGLVLELTPEEAKTVSLLPEVKMVEADKKISLNTDAGPQLIGADNVWTGSAPASGSAFGAGVVVGVLDSGANFDHPSFADVGGDGYDHTNPLGPGNYLGVCDPANADQFDAAYTCNDKIIGGYDFINSITPPSGFDIPGPEDENGHGTHTASTAAGNLVTDAEGNGVTGITVSGVARHANLVIFDVCYNPDPNEGGGCFGSAAAASIDQMISDGVVDVINYSISGGTSPWSESASLAFLSATDAGIFVSASAGNSGPGPGTLGHVEPWTASVGASTHNREFINLLSIVGEPTLQDISYSLSTGPQAPGQLIETVQYAGDIDAANFEGCNPFPASSFDNSVALISRGACAFSTKVNNAEAAGALAVVVRNNVAGGLRMGGLEGTNIPAVSVSLVDGDAMIAFVSANPGSEVQIDVPFISNAGQADVMAGFSSRGPSAFEVNKPDVTGPGVNILAGFADTDPSTGTPAEYGVISGTSMSSPHNAGAAALLKELNPNWTPAEIKSALMLTAVTAGVTKEDASTPADPFDRGAGRIQVDVASSTGLVMNETAFQFLLADPANGGDPKSLNLASYKNDNCVGTCSFQRKFRSVASVPVDYEASLSDMTGTVSPSSFTALPGQTITLDIEIDGTSLPAGDVSFGELVIDAVSPFAIQPGTAVPDSTYDGTEATMACESINISNLPPMVPSVELELGLDHTWAGDLTIKLRNPNGDELGVMSRPGFVEAADDGTGCCGANANFEASSPVLFSDTAAVSAEDVDPALGNDDVICAIDGICEFSPAPGSVANPPSTFADLLATDPNGSWLLCVGDSVGGDEGFIQSAELKFTGFDPVPPRMHLPLVVTGFPEAPEIAVAPTSLAATLDADTTTDVNLNISNAPTAGADLNWNFGAGTYSLVFAEQFDGTGTITNGIVSGFFTAENGGSGAGAYSADDFVLNQDAQIETMFFGGFANGVDIANTASSIQLQVFADNAGSPDGNPEDGLGSALFALDIPIADPSLDLTDNNILIDVAAANGGSTLDLPAGTYWVTVFPTQVANDGERWNWFASGPDVAGGTAQLISPIVFGVADWTGLPALTSEPNFEQLNYTIAGAESCGAPWISTSVSSGTVSPSNDEDVTVTLDATGLSSGVYSATLCVDSDDPNQPQVLVPVTMTVNGLSDLIFEDGFEGP